MSGWLIGTFRYSYPDNTVNFFDNHEDFQLLFNDISRNIIEIGLTKNVNKTKWMTFTKQVTPKVS